MVNLWKNKYVFGFTSDFYLGNNSSSKALTNFSKTQSWIFTLDQHLSVKKRNKVVSFHSSQKYFQFQKCLLNLK